MRDIMADSNFFIGQSVKPEVMTLKYGNRHGLITGATGTGKTVTLQTLAEGFSNAGVPVFAADIKGDLSGVSQPGEAKPFILDRAKAMNMKWQPDQFPVTFWDLFGEQGHPIRATISEMGPLLISRLLDLNETQEGVLNILFTYADKNGLLLLDLKDLRAMLTELGTNKDLSTKPLIGDVYDIVKVPRPLANRPFKERLETTDMWLGKIRYRPKG
jgi:DNA helicase HerA-like ATPase